MQIRKQEKVLCKMLEYEDYVWRRCNQDLEMCQLQEPLVAKIPHFWGFLDFSFDRFSYQGLIAYFSCFRVFCFVLEIQEILVQV